MRRGGGLTKRQEGLTALPGYIDEDLQPAEVSSGAWWVVDLGALASSALACLLIWGSIVYYL